MADEMAAQVTIYRNDADYRLIVRENVVLQEGNLD